jgi:hypothetical protein
MIQQEFIDNLEKYDEEARQSILKYIEQLGDKERIAYVIAKNHLGTSFDVVKSIGYITWKNNQSQIKNST